MFELDVQNYPVYCIYAVLMLTSILMLDAIVFNGRHVDMLVKLVLTASILAVLLGLAQSLIF